VRIVLAVGAIAAVIVSRWVAVLAVDGTLPVVGPTVDYETILFPVDILLLLLAVATVTDITGVRAAARRRDIAAGLWLAITLWLVVSWLAHPSSRGVVTLIEQLGAVALAATIAQMLRSGMARVVVAAITTVSVFEAVIAIAQKIHGGGIGLKALGEAPSLYEVVINGAAPQGTMRHPFILAGFCITCGGVIAVAIVRRVVGRGWLPAIALAVVPVGITYARTALLSVALFVACLGVGAVLGYRRRLEERPLDLLLVCIAGTIGFVLPAAIWSSGWTSRATATASAVTRGSADDLTTARPALMAEAGDIIGRHPVFGVGPGRYTIVLRDEHHGVFPSDVGSFRAVHDVPLLVAAEGGVPAGLLVLILLAVVGWRAVRAGPATTALFALYLPWMIIDKYPYSLFEGAVITGLWLGALDGFASSRRPATIR
jgi:hypothetical protein